MLKNFTPGPWRACNSGNHQGLVEAEHAGRYIAAVYDYCNTDLIAAAPKMLKILLVTEKLYQHQRECRYCDSRLGEEGECVEYRKMYREFQPDLLREEVLKELSE